MKSSADADEEKRRSVNKMAFMGEESWELLEDLPTELKNHPHVLELRLESLVCMRKWEIVEILGDSLAGIMPAKVSLWLSLARIRGHLGQREAALEAATRVTALGASKRLGMLDDPLLARVW